MDIAKLKAFIRDVPGFPKPGVVFKDITPLLGNIEAYQAVLSFMAEWYKGDHLDCIAAPEARGFLFAAPLADRLRVGLIPIRKAGKLPFRIRSITYNLEYGTATLEMHIDAVPKGARVAIIDDVLATGGTNLSAARLIEQSGGTVVGHGVLIELEPLGGRERLVDYRVDSVFKY